MRASARLRLAALWPGSVAGQIALLIVAAMVVTHAVATLAFFTLREPWRPDDHPGVAATRIATLARLLDATAPPERDALLRAAARTLPTLRIASWPTSAPAGTASEALAAHTVVQRVRDGFARSLAITDLDAADTPPGIRIGIVTPEGARFSALVPDDDRPPIRQGAIVVTFLFLAVVLSLVTVWAARALTRPLARLAQAAEAFGTRMNVVALPEGGPQEVIAVAQALDRMRARVRRLVDDRTQMLAAISHDLRTPITRLRLRAEFIEDDHARTMTLRDLDQMNGLVEAALSFVRDGQSGEERAVTLVDVASLVQTVSDAFADVGADVRVAATRHVLVRGRPEELQRAVTNLVDNAVKYGGGARLRIVQTEHVVAVEVGDDGPGIPDSEREAMLQPFVRGDRARNLDTASGFGLGLSIVVAIAEAHDGRLILTNRSPRGLTARLELPPAAGAARSVPERIAAE
ncbi:ATPase [Methylobacterium sp. Leaf99]|uniref:ATP-binding protein n=1 Tax=unclassified Methylobacterium TaxID=2615210 RepID=UPI0006F610A5|nr:MULTISPECIES: ATP-binding protein [unclassified Methylobacterium]KQP10551.1 ATPase [Methylobacterium sp. Leaf99]TXM79069.1 HAMP domain-containing protein [Methylobacterium sp. WL69]